MALVIASSVKDGRPRLACVASGIISPSKVLVEELRRLGIASTAFPIQVQI